MRECSSRRAKKRVRLPVLISIQKKFYAALGAGDAGTFAGTDVIRSIGRWLPGNVCNSCKVPKNSLENLNVPIYVSMQFCCDAATTAAAGFGC